MSERVSVRASQVACLEEVSLRDPCGFCHEREAVYTCLPFGPLDHVVFAKRDGHYRGFVAVPCCDWCKQRLTSGEALSAKVRGKSLLVSTWLVPRLFSNGETTPGTVEGDVDSLQRRKHA